MLLIFVSGEEIPEIVQLAKDDKFKLDGYTIRDTYLITGNERLVIASQHTADNADIEGLRLLYIKDDRIEFKSRDVGESYIYRPTFYRFKDKSLLIICEMGFEYSLGIDVFELSQEAIAKIGNIDIASNVDDNPTSIVPNMTIEKKYGDQYNFMFKGETIINPGGQKEKKIDGGLIKGIYLKETGNISLMIKSK